MKPLAESQLAPSITEAVATLAAAKEVVKAALAAVQVDCEHRFVSEMPWSTIQSAHRICNHCRLIERGSHWSGGSTWSKHDYGKSDLGNIEGRIVSLVTIDAFRTMRIAA